MRYWITRAAEAAVMIIGLGLWFFILIAFGDLPL